MSEFTQSLANAIAKMEGWLVPNSVAQRNHNPGNLRAGPGSVGTDSRGYAIFPDDATGFAALERQVDLNINRGLTLREFFAGKPGVYPGYAPQQDSNDPASYAQNVAGWLGISPDVILSGVSPGSFHRVALPARGLPQTGSKAPGKGK